MNEYIKNLKRIEFLVTLACTGKCRHCSEGEHPAGGEHINAEAAVRTVRELCSRYKIDSLMTFGGEPLLFPNEVYRIHSAARQAGIPKRQLITNGFFSKDSDVIRKTAESLAKSGVNMLLLSVDAFHQEHIPLEPVTEFAKAVQSAGIPIKTQPAWLVSEQDSNSYNLITRDILKGFEDIGIQPSGGNIIFPEGNALKYLSEYFDSDNPVENPYEEDPCDVRAICVSPNGSVLGGNINSAGILDIIEDYIPKR